jgi:TPR repeat protein
VDAQFGLGLAYDEAMGIKRDYKQASKWYTQAAEQGDAQSQVNLAIMYQQGNGVVQDYSRAAALYLEAAESGLADAQYSIGLYHHQGRAFERDDVMAHMWLNIASANGASLASEAREIIEGEMTRQEILLAQRLARQCVEDNYKNCGDER